MFDGQFAEFVNLVWDRSSKEYGNTQISKNSRSSVALHVDVVHVPAKRLRILEIYLPFRRFSAQCIPNPSRALELKLEEFR